jgi:hypothetical protein
MDHNEALEVIKESLKPFDILSEAFADFALDECEEFDRIQDRTEINVMASGQVSRVVVLGFASSFKDQSHTGHRPGTAPLKGRPCPACRWADVAVLKTITDDPQREPVSYVLVLMGKSEVPDEEHRIKTVWSDDPEEILRGMVVNNHNTGAKRKIPFTNATAFREAARVDTGIAAVCEQYDEVLPRPSEPGSYLGL